MLKIKKVQKKGIGKEIGLKKGDEIISFDGHKAVDILDYLFYDSKNKFLLTVKQRNGDISTSEIEKDDDESLGLEFISDNLDIKTCYNNCTFCFVDQMPKGLRETLYVKDDDYRQSFLCGNFVTLTNITDEDVERILRLNLSPLYISVHTTNGELRKKMTNNRKADKINDYLQVFSAHGIIMHAQIVLVKGVNDGVELEKSLRDLFKLYPSIRSVAVVPVGITKFREGLTKIEEFDEISSREVIDKVKKLNAEFKVNFVSLGDEFYFKANLPVEKFEFYGEFPQIENGVGTTAKFEREVFERLKECKTNKSKLIITGESASEFMKELCLKIGQKITGAKISVLSVKNDFFGDSVNCTGLLVGKDVINAVLSLCEKYDYILLPKHCFKETENVMLDGTTLKDLQVKLKTEIIITDGTGESFVSALER